MKMNPVTDEFRARSGTALDDDRPRFSFGPLVLLLLAGYLLFAHGCHGDEDNELLAQRDVAPISGARPLASGAERV